MRAANEPTIRLTYELIGSIDNARLEGVAEEKQKRCQKRLADNTLILTPDEAREFKELHDVSTTGLSAKTIQLVAGRTTLWSHFEAPMTVTACVTPDKQSIQLRFDVVGVEHPGTSQLFEIPNKASLILPKTSDGRALMELITPTIIEPTAAAEARPQPAPDKP